MVNRVIMRNFELILETPQLDHLKRTFFIDDGDCQNHVLFGMLLKQESLPIYQKDSNITGVDIYSQKICYPNKPNYQLMTEANDLFGSISESLVREQSCIYDCVHTSKETVD